MSEPPPVIYAVRRSGPPQHRLDGIGMNFPGMASSKYSRISPLGDTTVTPPLHSGVFFGRIVTAYTLPCSSTLIESRSPGMAAFST